MLAKNPLNKIVEHLIIFVYPMLKSEFIYFFVFFDHRMQSISSLLALGYGFGVIILLCSVMYSTLDSNGLR